MLAGESSLPSLQRTTLSLGLYMAEREAERGGERGNYLVSLLRRALIPSWGPTLMTSSHAGHLPKATSPNTTTLRVGASAYRFWRDTCSVHKPLRTGGPSTCGIAVGQEGPAGTAR